MRESRTLGSVRAKAEWLSYSTIPRFDPNHGISYFTCLAVKPASTVTSVPVI